MANGTIYWDEASRGLRENGKPYSRGRWVGEITINGRRMRKRSKDYNVVMDFVNAKEMEREKKGRRKLSSLIGFSRYGIDLVTGKIYNKRLKKEIKSDGIGVKLVDDNKKKKYLTHNRMMFACQRGIDYYKIPKSVVIVEDSEGNFVLKNRAELIHETSKKYLEEKHKQMVSILDTRIHEAQLLKKYYKTKDYSKLYEYMYSLRDKCVGYYINRRGWQKSRAKEFFEQSVENIMNDILDGPSTIANIGLRIRYDMKRQMEMYRNEHQDIILSKIGREY